ncbi:hypothetical protein KKC60_03005 [Patescibacteria group bacterium]|nr:hypothetical protein [Patescibacteria group bacterium]
MITIVLVTAFVVNFDTAKADDSAEELNIYFFHGDGCPHCADADEFFKNELEPTYPNLKIHRFELWYDKDNQKLLQKVVDELDIQGNSVPITIVGGKPIYGYGTDSTTGATIEKEIKRCLESAEACEDPVEGIVARHKGIDPQSIEEVSQIQPSLENAGEIPEKVKVPLFGDIEIKSFSLPVLSVILGTLDGFNPCAMWVLLFLISFLLKMENTFRRWVLGIAFILASGAVYFVFMAAWLNFFIFIGYIVWVRALIGLVALGTGIYNIREYYINKNATCKVTKNNKRQKTFEKLKKITSSTSFWVALGGIILLAFAVNLVELLCSLGLPAVFTNVLTLSNVPSYQYYLYILLYIFFFMLDDMIVFAVAMLTVKAFGLDSKYSRYSTLIGGLIILVIGILMLLKPEWLMFG